jgi:hypothetical protein
MSAKSLLERIRWLHTLQADRQVTPAALRVAIALAYRVNCQTGQCNPTMITLTADVAMSNRSVGRAVNMLQRLGYISVIKTWKYNQYVLLIPDTIVGCSEHQPTELSGDPPKHYYGLVEHYAKSK